MRAATSSGEHLEQLKCLIRYLQGPLSARAINMHLHPAREGRGRRTLHASWGFEGFGNKFGKLKDTLGNVTTL